MKKYVVALFCFILFGCAEGIIFETDIAPSKMIVNPQCENVSAVQIYRVSDKFALAKTCKESKYSGRLICWGHSVYVLKDETKIYYDEQIIKPDNGKCIAYTGVYRFKEDDKKTHTVPKIKFIDGEIENPEYKKYHEEKELNGNN